MKSKRLGGVVTVIGLAVLIVSAAANSLGVGDTSNFGWKQTTGSVLGAAIMVVGLAVLIFGKSSAPSAHEDSTQTLNDD